MTYWTYIAHSTDPYTSILWAVVFVSLFQLFHLIAIGIAPTSFEDGAVVVTSCLFWARIVSTLYITKYCQGRNTQFIFVVLVFVYIMTSRVAVKGIKRTKTSGKIETSLKWAESGKPCRQGKPRVLQCMYWPTWSLRKCQAVSVVPVEHVELATLRQSRVENARPNTGVSVPGAHCVRASHVCCWSHMVRCLYIMQKT